MKLFLNGRVLPVETSLVCYHLPVVFDTSVTIIELILEVLPRLVCRGFIGQKHLFVAHDTWVVDDHVYLIGNILIIDQDLCLIRHILHISYFHPQVYVPHSVYKRATGYYLGTVTYTKGKTLGVSSCISSARFKLRYAPILHPFK